MSQTQTTFITPKDPTRQDSTNVVALDTRDAASLLEMGRWRLANEEEVAEASKLRERTTGGHAA